MAGRPKTVCPECGRKSPTPRGLAMHMVRSHGAARARDRNGEVEVRPGRAAAFKKPPRKRTRRAPEPLRVELSAGSLVSRQLADFTQALFPEGIATSDPEQLELDLVLVVNLRDRLATA